MVSCSEKKKDVYIFLSDFKEKEHATSVHPGSLGFPDSAAVEKYMNDTLAYKELNLEKGQPPYFIVLQYKGSIHYFEPLSESREMDKKQLAGKEVYSLARLLSLLRRNSATFSKINKAYDFYFIVDSSENKYILNEADILLTPPYIVKTLLDADTVIFNLATITQLLRSAGFRN